MSHAGKVYRNKQTGSVVFVLASEWVIVSEHRVNRLDVLFLAGSNSGDRPVSGSRLSMYDSKSRPWLLFWEPISADYL